MKEYNLSDLNNLSDESDPNRIADVIKSLGSFNSMTITLNQNLVWRARFEKEPFEVQNASQVSFNPKFESIERGRANSKGESVFYGSFVPSEYIKDQDASYQGGLSAALEASKQIRSGVIQPEFGYISRWRLTKELTVNAFINHPFYGEYERIRQFRNEFREMNEKVSNSPKRDWDINNWVAKYFAHDYPVNYESAYKITSMIASNGYRQNEGIIYPSVRMTGKALVLAVHNSNCDKLVLDKIIRVKKNISGKYLIYQESDTIDSNGDVKWRKEFSPPKIIEP